ncbi:MAG: thioredoxin domain-containing protein [Acidobacteriales bacterium]|nr:thioredoxin domain-containing protein [Terriglobales bacterium]
MPENRLAREKSPYLLQHAHNPVDWYPWGEEAFEKARLEDKPVFLSVGYSTCHWCHVMERESFEDAAIAEVLNRNFVPVKVDREERPDVDRIYMLFVQASTGGGGWPMSVWLTPDLVPFYGGTYFPPVDAGGRPGFRSILERIAAAWRSEEQRIRESGGKALEQLRDYVEPLRHTGVLGEEVLDAGFRAFRGMFDPAHGGFETAPKFPRPVTLNFLLAFWRRTRNQEALDMALATLRGMARGGMCDHLGGGFHRYSVDERWFLPHFEKMLYDQAQLASAYLDAFRISGDKALAEVARGILEYVLRDMTNPQGAFYSAEDADSLIDPARGGEKGEGAFYVWTKSEITAVLGEPLGELFAWHYGVEAGGNVRHDVHGEFRSKNILYEAVPIGDADRAVIAEARAHLLKARSKRPRPHLDDKILTGWNGLMISAFAKAAHVLGDAAYLDVARRAAGFIWNSMYAPQSGVLMRRYRGGEAAVPGFLDDYVCFAQSLADLHEVTGEPGYLEKAILLADSFIQRFVDGNSGGFYATEENTNDLVLRIKDDYDGAEPSANSLAALLLLRLARFTCREDYQCAADRTLEAFAGRIEAAPHAMPQMLVAYMRSLEQPRNVCEDPRTRAALVGDVAGFDEITK